MGSAGSRSAFVAVAALLFAASAAATVAWVSSMPSMAGMSGALVWTPMCGETWTAAAASFLGMWVVMMAAMMLPSLAPMLWRYRQAVDATGEARLARLTALAAAGYFLVWTVVGLTAFGLGSMLVAAEMRQPALARAAPLAAGLIVLVCGGLQFTAWKAHQLACCRAAPERALPADGWTAWRHGLGLGRHCGLCCANLTAILLVVGVMDLHAMALVTAAITLERLAPNGERFAQAIGAVTVAVGLVLVAWAAGA
jgi:predicted metal-binding membrane protein